MARKCLQVQSRYRNPGRLVKLRAARWMTAATTDEIVIRLIKVASRRPLVLVGWLAALVAASCMRIFVSSEGWYPDLHKPSWHPPDLIFGLVWTFLWVVMMAVGAWSVWREIGGKAEWQAHLGCFPGNGCSKRCHALLCAGSNPEIVLARAGGSWRVADALSGNGLSFSVALNLAICRLNP